ncbi:efflux RND transporter periplasmic adaptor subunit [Nubsella zeaxanthinifaciens]|uniref:efflux RND transporter periplasmic adaptor subunit n=1 Tax=Nubsella zeaxanthinifaciens TaxID=392412 RepID=UPI000DE400FC|nr:efflux RND transporter periplasmic adaptor subunit [Nubsella zeaxanthinifaciens]
MKQSSIYLSLMGTALFLAACSSGNKDPKAGAPTGPQNYPVVQIDAMNTTLESDYPATLEGQQNVDIRPKIDGFIEKIYVDEGATVKQGQPLFKINAPQYEQAVRTAQAAISSAEAEVNAAQLQYNKTKPLVEKDIISKFDLDNAALTLTAKKANLAQAKAALVNAKVNLGYTVVSSPTNGVIGTIPYKVGALVSSTSQEPLTTVSSISKVYAYFSLNEKQLLQIARNTKGRTLEDKIKQIPSVTLVLADGSIYTEKGKIETVSGQINTATGSSSLRATFPNPNGLLRSGSSASIRIPQYVENALLVPQKSTTDIQGKKFVYLVTDTGGVKSTNVEIMELTKGNYYVVTQGLKPGNKIVLEGFASLKDGDKIKPQVKSADSVFAEAKNK